MLDGNDPSTQGAGREIWQAGGKYLDDLLPGDHFKTLSRTVTETDLVNFLGVSGIASPLFQDEVFARTQSDFSGRVVPALLVVSIGEGLLAATGAFHGAERALLHYEIDLKSPTLVGHTIHVETQILEVRTSRSRKDRGVVIARNEIRNEKGTCSVEYITTRLLARRSPIT